MKKSSLETKKSRRLKKIHEIPTQSFLQVFLKQILTVREEKNMKKKKTKRMIVKLVVGPREREREEGVRAETSHWHSELVIIRIKK